MQLLANEVQFIPITNITGEELSNYLTHYVQDHLAEHVQSGEISKISVSVSSSKGQSVTSSIDYKYKRETKVDPSKTNNTSMNDGTKYCVVTGGNEFIKNG
eukprot:462783_1